MSHRTAILVFPGTNREHDVAALVHSVTARRPAMIWHMEVDIPPVDAIIIPGGFSHGDYLRPGAIAARSPVMTEVMKKARQGVTVLGICNGFQILTEAGLLPGALIRNATLKFICRDVNLRVECADTRFTSHCHKGQIIRTPVANSDGNYFADPATLRRLEDDGRVVFRYCDAQGNVGAASNPGGSADSIAAIVNEDGNVMGMMPHPENATNPLHNPDGYALVENMLKHAA